MWAGLLAKFLGRPWARRAAGYALIALTITLFILNIRRTAERAGRAAERLDHLERSNAVQQKMLEASARRPRSRDDLLERLREGGF